MNSTAAHGPPRSPNTAVDTESPLMFVNPRPDVVMAHGSGSWLYDERDRAYLDFIQGWAVNSLGHCPPALIDALRCQSERLLSPSPAFHNRPALELAQLLTSATGMARAFFSNSGAEANECAIKLCRKWGRRHKDGAYRVLSTHGGFHGRTLHTMAASGKPGFEEMFPPNPPGFHKVPFGSVEAIREALDESVVAVLLEPIQGEAGVIVPPEGYLAELRELTQRTNTLLVLDEVQTGIGRTGTFTRYLNEQILPDIVTLGKGLGGGTPIAAVLAQEHAACFEAGEHGGTYCGNPLMSACALAVLGEVLREGFLEHVVSAGQRLRVGLEELVTRGLLTFTRGAGLLLAAGTPRANAEAVRDTCFELGLLVNAPRPDLLRFMPALTVTEDEIDLMLERLTMALHRHQAP